MEPISLSLIALIILAFFMGIRILWPKKVGAVLLLGKARRVIREGFNIVIPFLEYVSYQTLALTNLNIKVDGITKDNVNTAVNINVIYKVRDDDQSIKDSLFKNQNVVQTIKSLIEEQLRAKIFEFEHEEIFWKRNEIGDEIRQALAVKLAEFGMELDSVQVIDILLDSQVVQAMNQVVASQKAKMASITEAEGRKQAEILRAEWDKEVKRLIWEGMAEQRKAIANGFQESIEKIKSMDPTLTGAQILEFLLNSSRIETLEKIGAENAKVIYVNENLEGRASSMIANG
jgi:regulator of protease activity HflC (stomatin/prohibitin superfamily)